jgi:hypothetical protein
MIHALNLLDTFPLTHVLDTLLDRRDFAAAEKACALFKASSEDQKRIVIACLTTRQYKEAMRMAKM